MYGGDTLIPGSFDYLVAHSIEEAVGLLDQHGEDAKILAGGQSLIPLIRFRLARPSVLVDINRVPGLEYVQEADGTLHIGTMTREAELDSSSLIRDRYPILYDTSTMVADPVVRNWATVGGNLAHADPANDHPATMRCSRRFAFLRLSREVAGHISSSSVKWEIMPSLAWLLILHWMAVAM